MWFKKTLFLISELLELCSLRLEQGDGIAWDTGTFYPDGQIVSSVSMVIDERRVRWEEAESMLQSGQGSCD